MPFWNGKPTFGNSLGPIALNMRAANSDDRALPSIANGHPLFLELERAKLTHAQFAAVRRSVGLARVRRQSERARARRCRGNVGLGVTKALHLI